MEVVLLSFAVVLLAVLVLVAGSVIPFLFWRLLKLETKLEALDKRLSEQDELLAEHYKNVYGNAEQQP